MKYLGNCVTSPKRNCIKAEMKNSRFTCWGASCTVAPELLSSVKTFEVTRLTVSISRNSSVSPTLKNKLGHIFRQHVISPTPLEPSVNRGGGAVHHIWHGLPKIPLLPHECTLRIKLEMHSGQTTTVHPLHSSSKHLRKKMIYKKNI